MRCWILYVVYIASGQLAIVDSHPMYNVNKPALEEFCSFHSVLDYKLLLTTCSLSSSARPHLYSIASTFD